VNYYFRSVLGFYGKNIRNSKKKIIIYLFLTRTDTKLTEAEIPEFVSEYAIAIKASSARSAWT